MRWLLLSTLSLLLLTGCAHLFSDRVERLVDPDLTFEQVKSDPPAHIGKYLKVGGIIVETENTRQGSQVEVVQLRLDYQDYPDESYGSAGRFLAVSDRYLDSMIFKPGRFVALVGVVKGVETRPLGKTDYSYPVIGIEEIHIWKRADLYPRYYSGPYYYPYGGYDPFWYPYWPRYRHW